ncbi:ribonuclease H-like domain-containing protein, partial [Tanacetum coccineum]
TKIVHKRKKEKTLEEAYYTQFGAPYQSRGQYRAAGPGFYQRNNENSLYPDRRPSLEESLTKFMAESAKRHEENSNIIKEIRASTDVAIRNQGASIKTLDIQIGQMSKVLQERGFGSLPSSMKTNPRDQVKSISTTKADFSEICHIGCGLYTVSGMHHRSIISETVPFPRRLQNFGCDDWREAQDVKIIEAYDHTLPQKEKDPGSFTLPYFIHNICFGKAFVDLGASVSVMPFSTYTNLGLGILSHTRLTIKLADQTIKQPRGIAENVLVRIGKFIFPIDFIILDIPEDDDVPLILGRPFLSTVHSKIDVFKRKITLRAGEEKLVFKVLCLPLA